MPPAARLTDMATCPMQPRLAITDTPCRRSYRRPGCKDCSNGVTGVAAREITCCRPPDTIIKGSSTVMICGKPGARMGDTTAHGGQIVLGCPTVIIG